MNLDDGIYDLIIPGGGPGGLTAGLYAMRALGKEHESGACQSALRRWKNAVESLIEAGREPDSDTHER